MKLLTQFYLLFQLQQISIGKAMFQYFKQLCFQPSATKELSWDILLCQFLCANKIQGIGKYDKGYM